MKRVLLALTLTLVVAGVVGGTAASEDGPTSSIVGCTLLDGNGAPVGTLGVITVYDSGKVTLYCEAQGVANPTGGVVNWNYAKTGISCFIGGAGFTTVWRNRVGANGQAQLACETYVKDAVAARAAASSSGVG